MVTFNRNENVTLLQHEYQASQGYLRGDTVVNAANASNTSVHAAVTTAAVFTTNITNPDVARVARIVGTGADHDATGDVVIKGIRRGSPVTDTITLNSNTAVDGVKAFDTITSIDTTGVSGLDATAGVSVGTGNVFGLDRAPVIADTTAVLLATCAGAAETVTAVTTSDTDPSLNTVAFTTTPDGAKDFAAYYLTTEVVDAP